MSSSDRDKIKLYLYNLEHLDDIYSNYKFFSPEMDLFNYFLTNIKYHYTIVSNIYDADMAFIPIDFTKLIYPHPTYCIVPPNCPRIPPTCGVCYKEDTIKYFWDMFVKKKLQLNTKIKHFMLYSYVLYDINFSYIPNDIIIFSYENSISLSNQLNPILSDSKLIPIPYPLNDNAFFNQKIIRRHTEHEKIYNIAIFGSLDRSIHLKHYREFIKYLKMPIFSGCGENAYTYLKHVKYLFVLRGDTTTRLCFYQCFAFNIVPIIFEKELETIEKLLCPGIDIKKSCLILPNIECNEPVDYAIIVDKILEKELENDTNYLNKIKHHKEIFDNFNWYKEDDLCKPIQNIINYVINN